MLAPADSAHGLQQLHESDSACMQAGLPRFSDANCARGLLISVAQSRHSASTGDVHEQFTGGDAHSETVATGTSMGSNIELQMDARSDPGHKAS